MFRIFLLLFTLIFSNFFSQKITGLVRDEDGNALPATLVFNMETEQKIYTSLAGEFSIDAIAGQELRFVRAGFERSSKIISAADLDSKLIITLARDAAEIEEVKIVRLTGDIQQDSKNLAKEDRISQLQQEIGVPLPPEKPREKPADFKKDVVGNLLNLAVSPQAVYDLISGDARRMKTEYRYEDMQDNIAWILARVGDDYFTELGISPEKTKAFVQYSLGIEPEISRAVKARNLAKVLLYFEQTLPKFLNR
ncbi:hypothetical protein SAMN05421638_1639 [Kaistella treverensis]|uniref:Carboxypeptidase regulatory-like domain-containing protein n=1 Tax=Kaistella treverensis TaxID=631455 RepID=A0A1I3MAY8_9FLAO|nr:carboxypeptidase-like regulatory domain-containing protein [Kaistella treverensis]SFI94153.1 hypothetical protein SAMN05421638_1639 [Kaistella treverensis]